jgi:hypothetical protein
MPKKDWALLTGTRWLVYLAQAGGRRRSMEMRKRLVSPPGYNKLLKILPYI